LWANSQSYNSQGILDCSDLAALFHSVTYHRDRATLSISVNPWILRYLNEVEYLHEIQQINSMIVGFNSLPFSGSSHVQDILLEHEEEEEEEEDINDDNVRDKQKGKERDVEAEPAERDNESKPTMSSLPRKTQLKILGGLIEYLENSQQTYFTVRPRLITYDRNKSSKTVSCLAGVAQYRFAPWGDGIDAICITYRIVPFFFRQTAAGPDVHLIPRLIATL